MNKTRIGIIGCGGIAMSKHLPALARHPEVEVTAFCNRTRARAEAAAAQYGTPDARIYTDYRDLLADPAVDAVHVLVSNRLHCQITVDALRAGKHVMCEKPMAITSGEAQAMVDAAKENGRLLTIAYQERCRPEVQYLKRLCENGELGDIYYAEAHALRRRAVPTWGVFLDAEEQGGGPLIDIGTHALDLTLWLMDNYEPRMVVGSVYRKLADQPGGNAWGDWDPAKYGVEDSAFAFITMKNGATIRLDASWALNMLDAQEGTATLCGTKAGADMKDGLRLNGVRYGKQYTELPAFPSEDEVRFESRNDPDPADLECENWISAIRHGTPLRVLPEQALVVTRILEAVYTSARTGQPVYF